MTKQRSNKIISLLNNLDLDNYDKVILNYNKETMSINIDHEPSQLTVKLILDERDDLKPLLEHEKNSLLNLKWNDSNIDYNNLLDDVKPIKTKIYRAEVSNIITIGNEDFILPEHIYKFLKTKDTHIYTGKYTANNLLELKGTLKQPSNKDIVFSIRYFTIKVNTGGEVQ